MQRQYRFVSLFESSIAHAYSPVGFHEIGGESADVFSLLINRTRDERPTAMQIDDVIKAAEEIAAGRKGPHYIVKVIRSKL